MNDFDAIDAALDFIPALDMLDIPYVIGGSLASSLHGKARATHDADLVAEAAGPRARHAVDRVALHPGPLEVAARERAGERAQDHALTVDAARAGRHRARHVAARPPALPGAAAASIRS